MSYTWTISTLTELSATRLLEILRLRSEVFVVEQQCIYIDPDEFDEQALHLYATDADKVVAYARILKPSTRFIEPSIGRVLTASSHRRTGLGKELMSRAVQECCNRFEHTVIRISAQCYLQKFYTDLGFIIDSEEYDEDGIPHVEMVWRRMA